MKLQRELRQRGVKANLSFDKLIAGGRSIPTTWPEQIPLKRLIAELSGQGELVPYRRQSLGLVVCGGKNTRSGHGFNSRDL